MTLDKFTWHLNFKTFLIKLFLFFRIRTFRCRWRQAPPVLQVDQLGRPPQKKHPGTLRAEHQQQPRRQQLLRRVHRNATRRFAGRRSGRFRRLQGLLVHRRLHPLPEQSRSKGFTGWAVPAEPEQETDHFEPCRMHTQGKKRKLLPFKKVFFWIN